MNSIIKKMFECSVHYGHLTSSWNPKMKKFIFGIYNNIHIINLDKTLFFLKIALKELKKIYNNNGKILFVGTKSVAKKNIENIAKLSNNYFVNNRWLGGTLTNWKTVKQSIKKYKLLNINFKNLIKSNITKKEYIICERNLKKLEKNLSGIQNMNKLPDALFIIDVKHENIAVKESIKLNIPIFAIVDTDSNPDNINYIIPGNDDSIKSIDFYLSYINNFIK